MFIVIWSLEYALKLNPHGVRPLGFKNVNQISTWYWNRLWFLFKLAPLTQLTLWGKAEVHLHSENNNTKDYWSFFRRSVTHGWRSRPIVTTERQKNIQYEKIKGFVFAFCWWRWIRPLLLMRWCQLDLMALVFALRSLELSPELHICICGDEGGFRSPEVMSDACYCQVETNVVIEFRSLKILTSDHRESGPSSGQIISPMFPAGVKIQRSLDRPDFSPPFQHERKFSTLDSNFC